MYVFFQLYIVCNDVYVIGTTKWDECLLRDSPRIAAPNTHHKRDGYGVRRMHGRSFVERQYESVRLHNLTSMVMNSKEISIQKALITGRKLWTDHRSNIQSLLSIALPDNVPSVLIDLVRDYTLPSNHK